VVGPTQDRALGLIAEFGLDTFAQYSVRIVYIRIVAAHDLGALRYKMDQPDRVLPRRPGGPA